MTELEIMQKQIESLKELIEVQNKVIETLKLQPQQVQIQYVPYQPNYQQYYYPYQNPYQNPYYQYPYGNQCGGLSGGYATSGLAQQQANVQGYGQNCGLSNQYILSLAK